MSTYKERSDAAGIPKIDDLTALMREFGVGLVVSDQEPLKLTDSNQLSVEEMASRLTEYGEENYSEDTVHTS